MRDSERQRKREEEQSSAKKLMEWKFQIVAMGSVEETKTYKIFIKSFSGRELSLIVTEDHEIKTHKLKIQRQ